ncbi:MAG TPA: helix-turn-helix domain-containing protein [Thermoleophilaceae bacterium]|nr:helix-turn-helix domain-containing protein [Thermoleophilaceae bacterium]
MATPEALADSAPRMRADARRNRERIIQAAREAFAEDGADTQMDDVARRAGVGVGTLYRHFATKDLLVGELVRVKLSDFAAIVRARLEQGGDPWETFRGAVLDQANVMASDAVHQSMVFATTPESVAQAQSGIHAIQEAWSEVLRRAKEAGEIREDFTVDDIRTMMCGLGSMMAADRLGVMRYDWRRQLEFTLDGVRAR